MADVVIAPRAGGVPADLGRPDPPGSKSHAQRALLLAAGCAGRGAPVLRGVPGGDDVAVLARALGDLGAEGVRAGGGARLRRALPWAPAGRVHLGENGTALRTLPLLVALLEGRVVVDGAPGLRRRPLAEVLAVLGRAGVRTSGEELPLELDARDAAWPEAVEVDARRTTQAATGVLIGAAARLWHGRSAPVVTVRAPVASGYVELTLAMLRAFGVAVEVVAAGDDVSVALRGAGEPPAGYAVPPDASALVLPRALAAMHGHAVAAGPADDAHPDHGITRDLERLRTAAKGSTVELALGPRPDTFPALASVAALRAGRTVLGGAPALRHKESDRVAAMAAGLAAAGVAVEERDDGLVVRGPLGRAGSRLRLPAPADHRVVMALALLGTVVEPGVVLPHRECVAKSWPGYWEWLARVGVVSGG